VLFESAMATKFIMEKVSAQKKELLRFPPWFLSSLSPIPNLSTCPPSLASREHISVVIPIDHLRKKEAIMQKANVGHGKSKMDEMVRRRQLPCIRCSRPLYRGRVVCGAVPMSVESKKVMMKERRSKKKIGGSKFLCPQAEF
jgi:hypothetical protein